MPAQFGEIGNQADGFTQVGAGLLELMTFHVGHAPIFVSDNRALN
jgi:hypothetical protein